MRISIQELGAGVDQLHVQGIRSWTYLTQYRNFRNELVRRPALQPALNNTWDIVTTALYSKSVLGLCNLLDKKGALRVEWALNAAQQNSKASEWKVSEAELLAAIQKDKDELESMRLACGDILKLRDKVIAHVDTCHVADPNFESTLSVPVAGLRDSLYGISRILNRYSGWLNDTFKPWNDPRIWDTTKLFMLLECGHDARTHAFLPGDSPAPNPVLTWEQQGRLESWPEEVHQHSWKWDWLERYKRDAVAGTWT